MRRSVSRLNSCLTWQVVKKKLREYIEQVIALVTVSLESPAKKANWKEDQTFIEGVEKMAKQKEGPRKKAIWKIGHVEIMPFEKKPVLMQSPVQIFQLEFRGMWNGEVWAKNVSRSVKFFSFNSLLNKNKRMVFLQKGSDGCGISG